MLKIISAAALIAGLSGCYSATRTTVDLGQAEQNMAAARAAGAPDRAVYAWTMADEYMKKARDEWARSDFESAESMVKKATRWADEAASIARAGGDAPSWGVEDALQDSSEPPPTPEPISAPPAEEGSGVWN